MSSPILHRPFWRQPQGWPSTVTAARGWTEFRAASVTRRDQRPLLRAMLEHFRTAIVCWWEGYQRARQLYRSDQDRRDLGRRPDIRGGGVASILVTRRTVGRIESINAASRAIMLSGLDKRIPLRGQP